MDGHLRENESTPTRHSTRRNCEVHILFTGEELAQIRSCADECGIGLVAPFVRLCTMRSVKEMGPGAQNG